MNERYTATFIGHSECYGVTEENIKSAIRELVGKGVTEFLSGGMGQFDRMCAGAVNALKKDYPQIRNILVIPYLSFAVAQADDFFDQILYPEGFEKYHFKSAIPARNKYLVDNSAYAICYITHDWGGAAKTYDYAVKNGLQIINLALGLNYLHIKNTKPCP